MLLVHLNGGDSVSIEPESLARVQFYSTSKAGEDADWVYTFYDAVQCSDFYASQIETDPFFANEFSGEGWICPDVKDITVLNNPFLFDFG